MTSGGGAREVGICARGFEGGGALNLFLEDIVFTTCNENLMTKKRDVWSNMYNK